MIVEYNRELKYKIVEVKIPKSIKRRINRKRKKLGIC